MIQISSNKVIYICIHKALVTNIIAINPLISVSHSINNPNDICIISFCSIQHKYNPDDIGIIWHEYHSNISPVSRTFFYHIIMERSIILMLYVDWLLW